MSWHWGQSHPKIVVLRILKSANSDKTGALAFVEYEFIKAVD